MPRETDQSSALLRVATVAWLGILLYFCWSAWPEYVIGVVAGALALWIWVRGRDVIEGVEAWVIEDWIVGAHQAHDPYRAIGECTERTCEDGRAVIEAMRR